MTTGPSTEAKPRRLGRLIVGLGALTLAGSTAFFTWWTTTLLGLPDVGDPFDVAAFERPIPDETNAFVLYKRATAILPMPPDELTADWSSAGPAERQWLEASREALEVWREGTERPDALEIPPGNLNFEVKLEVAQTLRNFARLALLQGSKLETEGDVGGALDWYLALLRSSRHCGRRGTYIERVIGCAMNNIVSPRLTRWAADPRADAKLLRKALGAAYAAEAATPPTSDAVKAEYLSLLHSLDDPELMLRIHASYTTPTPNGGSVTHYPQLRWSSNITRLRRRALNEPERSRRVIRLIFANWLAYCDRPPGQRPSRVVPDPQMAHDHARAILLDLYAVDATAPEPARALPPVKIARWSASSIDADMALPSNLSIERAIDRERVTQGALLVAIANELHQREHGQYPDRVEELVGPYLKVLPYGHGSGK